MDDIANKSGERILTELVLRYWDASAAAAAQALAGSGPPCACCKIPVHDDGDGCEMPPVYCDYCDIGWNSPDEMDETCEHYRHINLILESVEVCALSKMFALCGGKKTRCAAAGSGEYVNLACFTHDGRRFPPAIETAFREAIDIVYRRTRLWTVQRWIVVFYDGNSYLVAGSGGSSVWAVRLSAESINFGVRELVIDGIARTIASALSKEDSA